MDETTRVLGYAASPFENALSLMYGRAMRLLGASVQLRERSLRDMQRRLWPAVRLRQIEFVYDARGLATGFVTWAFLTQDVAAYFEHDSDYVLDISEWNEGDQLWIVDLVAPTGSVRDLCRKLQRSHFPYGRRVRAMRQYSDGRRRRMVELSVGGVGRHSDSSAGGARTFDPVS